MPNPNKPLTIAYLLQKKYCAKKALPQRLKQGLAEKSIFVEDIELDISENGPVFTHEGAPLGAEADCMAPYFVADATPRDHIIMSIFRSLMRAGIPCLNTPESYHICGDKIGALAFAAKHGFRTPKTSLIDPDTIDFEKPADCYYYGLLKSGYKRRYEQLRLKFSFSGQEK